MDDAKREKIPLDVRLVSEAVTELNISRRSVSLYPGDHPITRESIQRAYDRLLQLFHLRNAITLGVAKDALVVDEYIIDKKNPVFREFAAALSTKGLAAVTFSAGLTMEELIGFHEIIIAKDTKTVQEILDLAVRKGLTNIHLKPLDLSKLGFVEGGIREEGSERRIWEDYVFGLLEGRLVEGDAEGMLLTIPSGQVADAINKGSSAGKKEESYDRVIAAYLTQRGKSELKRETFLRFLDVIQGLEPEVRQQFVQRAFEYSSPDAAQIDGALRELGGNDLERALRVLTESGSLVSDRLKGLIEKLEGTKAQPSFFEMLDRERKVVDDIELDASMMKLFEVEQTTSFVSDAYEKELEKMLEGVDRRVTAFSDEVRRECADDVFENAVAEILIELLESDSMSREVCLTTLTRLSELVDSFLETGRFLAVSEIYNGLYSHTLTGRFKAEVAGMIEYFFRSEAFLTRFIESCMLWGRHEREGVFRLANVLRYSLIPPFLDSLCKDTDAALRRFILDVLVKLGNDVLPEAVKRLGDDRWFVVRNMIYLIRECGGSKYVPEIRSLVKHPDKRVSIEAMKTLLALHASDAFSYLKEYLESQDPRVREQGVKLAGFSRDKRAVPHLLDLLDRRDVLGREVEQKIQVIRALGEIGDPAALASLGRLYTSKPLFARTQFEEVKVEIFRTLRHYPLAAAGSLLDLGVRSKHPEIRSISETLLKAGATHDGERKGN